MMLQRSMLGSSETAHIAALQHSVTRLSWTVKLAGGANIGHLLQATTAPPKSSEHLDLPMPAHRRASVFSELQKQLQGGITAGNQRYYHQPHNPATSPVHHAVPTADSSHHITPGCAAVHPNAARARSCPSPSDNKRPLLQLRACTRPTPLAGLRIAVKDEACESLMVLAARRAASDTNMIKQAQQLQRASSTESQLPAPSSTTQSSSSPTPTAVTAEQTQQQHQQLLRLSLESFDPESWLFAVPKRGSQGGSLVSSHTAAPCNKQSVAGEQRIRDSFSSTAMHQGHGREQGLGAQSAGLASSKLSVIKSSGVTSRRPRLSLPLQLLQQPALAQDTCKCPQQLAAAQAAGASHISQPQGLHGCSPQPTATAASLAFTSLDDLDMVLQDHDTPSLMNTPRQCGEPADGTCSNSSNTAATLPLPAATCFAREDASSPGQAAAAAATRAATITVTDDISTAGSRPAAAAAVAGGNEASMVSCLKAKCATLELENGMLSRLLARLAGNELKVDRLQYANALLKEELRATKAREAELEARNKALEAIRLDTYRKDDDRLLDARKRLRGLEEELKAAKACEAQLQEHCKQLKVVQQELTERLVEATGMLQGNSAQLAQGQKQQQIVVSQPTVAVTAGSACVPPRTPTKAAAPAAAARQSAVVSSVSASSPSSVLAAARNAPRSTQPIHVFAIRKGDLQDQRMAAPASAQAAQKLGSHRLIDLRSSFTSSCASVQSSRDSTCRGRADSSWACTARSTCRGMKKDPATAYRLRPARQLQCTS